MANGTTDTPAAATGRATRCTTQAATPASSATHDTAAYLTGDMLPDHLSRFADYVTAARQESLPAFRSEEPHHLHHVHWVLAETFPISESSFWPKLCSACSMLSMWSVQGLEVKSV
ncbi:uncharacterized protein CPUR_08754 [Claviceps purpurea 20.1]|uniref:Uncharacterized protein n=1 Tax=Claviceps purpurea (strain 20.1) TaxID=1111077 RepID=M1WDI1_CLAP2|nr:uncharacterized protein CPUR_08754 [Claviceps purpurea 20.1]